MTGASAPQSVPDLPWGKVAGVAGGLAAAYLTVRGVVALTRAVAHEAHDRFLDGNFPRRG